MLILGETAHMCAPRLLWTAQSLPDPLEMPDSICPTSCKVSWNNEVCLELRLRVTLQQAWQC